jgi:hypothetical protein
MTLRVKGNGKLPKRVLGWKVLAVVVMRDASGPSTAFVDEADELHSE